MKRIALLFIAIVLCLSLSACESPGTTNHAVVDYGSSVWYTKAEIESAIKVVMKEFKDLKSCDLLRIWYDEDKTNREYAYDQKSLNSPLRGVKRENLIVLLSDFHVGSAGSASGFSPDSTVTNFSWTLTRKSVNSPWVLYDAGYS